MKFWLIVLLFLTGCAEKVQDPPEVGANIDIPAFVWRVRDPATITQEHGAVAGHTVMAYVGKTPNGTIVITTPPPRTVDDQVACSLGHEVLHLAIGAYHP